MVRRVFVTYPLSGQMLDKVLFDSHDELEQISLSYLKSLTFFSILKILRSTLKMQVILENKESEKLYDIFLFLFLFSRSQKIEFIKEDLSMVSLGKKDALLSLVKCIGATIFGFYLALKSLIFSQLVKIRKKKPIFNGCNKVLYLKTNFWFGIKAGGSVSHVEGVVSGLKKKGIEVDYAGIDCLPSLAALVKKKFLIPIPNFLSLDANLNLYMFDWLSYFYLKKEKLKSYNFIYHRMALNSLSSILLSQKLRIPLILEYNGSEVWVQRNWGKAILFEKISQIIENTNIHCADYIVTVSDVLKEELIQRGISDEKIICYPNCVDPEKFNPALFSKETLLKEREKLGFAKNDLIFTFVGTFGKWHGAEVLAKAIQRLFETEPQWLKKNHVKFLFVGDGACMPEVKEILSSIPDNSRFITFTGLVPQEEAPLYLALSDVLLAPHSPPTRKERFFGSPTKLFEYMAMEKIIIGSDLEQIGEVLSPSVHIKKINEINESHLAILCEPGNVDHFKNAIHYVVDNLSSLISLRHNVRSKVIKKYTWTRHVEEIIKRIK